MIFVLLARDEAAPVAIEAWISERIRTGKNHPKDAQITEAQKCADIMRGQREPLREAIHMVDRFNHRDSRLGFSGCGSRDQKWTEKSPTGRALRNF